jgi:hypothetical protein
LVCIPFLKEEHVDCHAFAFRKLGNSAQHELDLVSSLDRAGGIRIGPDLERLFGDELVPVTPQGTAVLAGHSPSDTDHPGPKPVRLPQSRDVTVGPQETFLRQVVNDGGVVSHPVNHGPDKARVSVIQAAERIAVASQNSGHQIRIGRFVVAGHQ